MGRSVRQNVERVVDGDGLGLGDVLSIVVPHERGDLGLIIAE